MRFQTAVISGLLRRALVRRLSRVSRPSGLFYPVLMASVGGLFAAVDAHSAPPSLALGSIWLYRAEVGLAFMGAVYIAGIVLWLAWHGRGFFELGAFGVTLKATEAREIEEAGADVSDLAEQIVDSLAQMSVGLRELDGRISSLEERRPSS